MDVNTIVQELHEHIVRARKAGLSSTAAQKRISKFEYARAQHVVERINMLRAMLEKKLHMQLPHDYDELDKKIITLPEIEPSEIRMPRFPSAVEEEMRADFDEMNQCLEAKCFRSAIILCARMLETALHAKHYEVTGNDLLEKAPGIGLGNLIAKLSERGVLVDPGLSNQIHFINQVRVHSVHKKQAVFEPSELQARAIVMYMMEVIKN